MSTSSEQAAKKRNLGDVSVVDVVPVPADVLAANELSDAPLGAYLERSDGDHRIRVMYVKALDRSVHELRFVYDASQCRWLLALESDDFGTAVETLRKVGALIGVEHAAAACSSVVSAVFEDLQSLLMTLTLASVEADTYLDQVQRACNSGDFCDCLAAASCEELLRLEARTEDIKVAIEQWLISQRLELRVRLSAFAAASANLKNALSRGGDMGALVNAAHAAFKLEKDACMKVTPAELAKYLLDRASTHKLTLEPQE